MFKNIAVFLFVICFSGSSVLYAQDAAGKFPNNMKTGEAELTLKGVGVRTKLFVDVYLGGLYLNEKLNEKNTDAKALVKANEPMAIRLKITSGLINSENMADATREGFEMSTDGNVKPIKHQIDKFIAVFQEEIEDNDAYNIVYQPTEGVLVYKNDELRINIKGLEFKEALFGIWLGDDPVDEDLKSGMLGEE